MFRLDLSDASRSPQLFQRLSLAPCERRAALDGVLLVSLGFLERFGMLLPEPDPFDLLLKKTECAAAARAPFVVFREAKPRAVENLKHAALVYARILKGSLITRLSCLEE